MKRPLIDLIWSRRLASIADLSDILEEHAWPPAPIHNPSLTLSPKKKKKKKKHIKKSKNHLSTTFGRQSAHSNGGHHCHATLL
jgi:hypothetical protein